jgi:hypothetical protein
MEATIASLNDMLRGWFGYFKHSSRDRLDGLDSYIRGRLRSILRKRMGRRGRGRGYDHQRWRNHYFDEAGLVQPDASPRLGPSVSARSLTPTGEPDAGNPPVRFGGRGGLHPRPYPLSTEGSWWGCFLAGRLTGGRRVE